MEGAKAMVGNFRNRKFRKFEKGGEKREKRGQGERELRGITGNYGGDRRGRTEIECQKGISKCDAIRAHLLLFGRK